MYWKGILALALYEVRKHGDIGPTDDGRRLLSLCRNRVPPARLAAKLLTALEVHDDLGRNVLNALVFLVANQTHLGTALAARPFAIRD